MKIRKTLAGLGIGVLLAGGATALTAQPAAAQSYINVKNSVNSDHYIRVYRDFSPDKDVNYLSAGEHAVLYNGDDSVRIKVYLADGINSFQYYYGGTWHACHTGGQDITNPTDNYYDVTIRTFRSLNCEGRN